MKKSKAKSVNSGSVRPVGAGRIFSSEVLSKVAEKGTLKASKEAFKGQDTLLVEKQGWIVKVNSSGRVIRRVHLLSKVKIKALDLT
jgi:hypothetical protein